MTEEELRALLALYHVPGVGPATLNRLLSDVPSPCHVLGLTADALAAKLGTRQLALVDSLLRCMDDGADSRIAADRALAWLHSGSDEQRHILTGNDDDYPFLLHQISCPPPLLFMKGCREALGVPALAVVGSRRASHYGCETAQAISTDICRAGLAICSGLASGIDTAAHSAAVSVHSITIAVMGSGVERVYPASNRRLAAEVQERGLLISEFPLYATPDAGHFPRRNRIISGLSLGVLVVEAAMRSGSLITARQALEQDRDVFAVPGPVHREGSRGCHQLIREGAVLTESAADVLAVLRPEHGLPMMASVPPTPGLPPVLIPEHQQVLACMDAEPVDMDRLVVRTGLSVSALSRILAKLEMLGRITHDFAGYRRLA